MPDWTEQANRWRAKCNVCGSDDDRFISFGICRDCKMGRSKKEAMQEVVDASESLMMKLSEDSNDYPDSSAYRQTMDGIERIRKAIERHRRVQ